MAAPAGPADKPKPAPAPVIPAAVMPVATTTPYPAAAPAPAAAAAFAASVALFRWFWLSDFSGLALVAACSRMPLSTCAKQAHFGGSTQPSMQTIRIESTVLEKFAGVIGTDRDRMQNYVDETVPQKCSQATSLPAQLGLGR